jgi:NAD(P)-dependent dehydrogenase (short-subunit alcohol dehydrogenase family)
VVIVVDNGVGAQGEPLDEPTAAETVKRIEADGGTARASTVSVTDADAVRGLFEEVGREFGRVDMVLNAAGIVCFAPLVDTTDHDWASVLDVHINGYCNVLNAALPLMVAAGSGRVVGFTSGVGLARTSGNGLAYGSAKRAVASITWELAPLLPAGVAVNCLSPIAATRMVRNALVASGAVVGGAAGAGGLDLSAMPQAEDMAPAAACLAGDRLDWCRGEVVFSAGSELTVIGRPRLLEVVRTEAVADFGAALGTVVPVVLAPVEAAQRTSGGSNPRFGDVFGAAPSGASTSAPPARARCLIVSDDAALAAAVGSAVGGWGFTPLEIDAAAITGGFDAVARRLDDVSRAGPPVDAVVVIGSADRHQPATEGPAWQHLIDAHAGTAEHVLAHAAWLRAATRQAAPPRRIVHVTPATTAAGRTGAQAVAQMARSANETPTPVPLDAFAVSVETALPDHPIDVQALGGLVARLVAAEDTRGLRGAELVVGRGWMGLRSHPGPLATISFGGPAIPGWVDEALRQAALR